MCTCVASPALKACPFCGSSGVVSESRDHHGDFYSLGCSSDVCVCSVGRYTVYCKDVSLSDSIALWNSRSCVVESGSACSEVMAGWELCCRSDAEEFRHRVNGGGWSAWCRGVSSDLPRFRPYQYRRRIKAVLVPWEREDVQLRDFWRLLLHSPTGADLECTGVCDDGLYTAIGMVGWKDLLHEGWTWGDAPKPCGKEKG